MFLLSCQQKHLLMQICCATRVIPVAEMEIKRKGLLLRQITEDLDAAIARCFNIKDRSDRTLQALVYHILLPTTAITAYAIGLRKIIS